MAGKCPQLLLFLITYCQLIMRQMSNLVSLSWRWLRAEGWCHVKEYMRDP